MRYPPNLLEEILRRTDIVQLVGRRVKLIRKGRVFWGCCPFHKEKTPSFKVENERRNFKCFGCGKGGDAFRWLMETEGLSFPESVERLAGEAGVELPKWSAEDEAREEKRKSLYDIVEIAAAFYEAQLRDRAGATARDYLKSRGLDEPIWKQFRLGYAPTSSTLIEHLKTKNITQDDMIAAGLARPSENDRPMRDFFFNRVMFPITDARGRCVAFGARALDPDAKPKYINTGETPLFSKGHLLYNFATARPAAIKSQSIVVAEGYIDVIALVRAGIEAAVAPLGTALTEDQLRLLWRTAPEPVLAFDGDEAGLRAAHRAARLALPHLRPGMSLRFAFLPAGEDPDSLIRQSGPAAIRKVLDDAEPLARTLWRAETEGRDFSTPERRAGLERALADVVAQISDTKIQDYYRRDFEQKVFENFKRRGSPTRGPRSSPGQAYSASSERRRESRTATLQRLGTSEHVSTAVKASLIARTGHTGVRRIKETELARLLLAEPWLAQKHTELLAALVFRDPSLDSLRRELLNVAASGKRLESRGFENHLVGQGMAELVARLGGQQSSGDTAPKGEESRGGDVGDQEAHFVRAVASLRELTEFEPERARAVERFNDQPNDENWADAQRLLVGRTFSND
jgi:DNA primase